MAQTSSKQCDLCSQEDGKHFCYDCQQALCDICRKKHEKIPSLVDHKLTNLQQVDLSSFNTKSNCESHRTEFTIYCKTCLCLVCLKCVTSIHAGHEFCDIENVVSAERQDVATTITDLKSKVKSLLDLKEQIKCVHLEKNQANAKKVLKDITETFKDLAQMIEHKKQIKQTEVEDFEELERQQLESFLRNVDSVLRKYTRLCEELENLLTMKHDTTFYLCYKTLKHDVENQDSIPDEPMLNEIQPFDARDVYKEILDFINSKFEMRLCGNCVDQGKQIDELMKENEEFKGNIQRDILQLEKLSTKFQDAESSFIAEKNFLQRELQSKIEEIEQSQENITDLEEQLKRMKEKCEKFEFENHNLKVIERGTDTLLEAKSVKKEPMNSKNNASDSQSTRFMRPTTYSSSTLSPEMIFQTTEGLIIKVYAGNILKLNVDCIVNYANENLVHCGGFADVISRAAGYRLQKESDDYIYQNGQLGVGGCCSTTAGDLHYKYVIHAVGPRWSSYPTDKKGCAFDLKKTIENCFMEAEWTKMTSIALPAISAGIFGVPKEICCSRYCQAVIDYSYKRGKATCLKEIHFIDKDTSIVAMIQKEFGQNLNLTQSSAASGSRISQSSTVSGGRVFNPNWGSHDNTGRFERSLSDPNDKNNLATGNTSNEGNMAQTVKDGTFQKQYITAKGFKVTVFAGNITTMNVDVIICPQDDNCLSIGRIAKAIESISDERYRNEIMRMKHINKCEVRKLLASPPTLPFTYVLNTVAPRWDREAVNDIKQFMRDLSLTIRNILRHCSDSKNISTAAIPILGVGVGGHETPFESYASILSKEIKKESEDKKLNFKELFVVCSDERMVSAVAGQLDKEDAFTKLTSFQRQRRPQTKDGGTDFDRSRNRGSTAGDTASNEGTGNDKLGKTFKGDNLENCVICMDTPNIPRELTCGHVFCQECIGQLFKLFNPVCPTCGSIQGIMTGNQPPGTMKIYRKPNSLAGYPNCGRIEISYNIHTGKQGPEHHTPGRYFGGISRTGYLPDNRKGQLVAKMLIIAFDRKLIFTIGDSRTTGKTGVVIWNDIHHKTNPTPCAQFGYPDPTYLDRVIDELAAKGVTEKDVPPDMPLA